MGLGFDLGHKLRSFFMETSYVARIYADSLRDNFVGYVPLDQAKFEVLRREFEDEAALPSPHLAQLLKIEAALLETMPDNVMLARFWAIDDRFQRVVPLATRTRYERSVPARGNQIWRDPNFVRDQQRALLDVVHANYLINIGREKSIKRLKGIILLAFAVVAFVAFCMFRYVESPRIVGLSLLAFAGIFGAMLSVTQRLQVAVSRDAMTEDGVYELTGLRIGWVGVITSSLMGGAFALVLYAIVMAGALDVAYPKLADVPDPRAAPTEVTDRVARDSAGGEPIVGSPATELRSDAEPPSARPRSQLSPDLARQQIAGADRPAGKVDGIAAGLGLAGVTNLFKMLVLAFLAGFAERFVPDILGRLSKHPAPS